MALVLRRRYAWPASDLLTGSASLDDGIDSVLAKARRRPNPLNPDAYDPAATVAVVGFPRSANTMLTSWLRHVARPGVDVVDGRYTHSALDVRRLAMAGIPVLVPVRHPLDACASMLVRQGAHGSEESARGLLRAYAAWHNTARRELRRTIVRLATFTDITSDPSSIVADRPFADLVDAEAVLASDVDVVMESTRRELQTVIGQGQPENGIASHLMISLPDAGRATELADARGVLCQPRLARHLTKAERAYEAFLDAGAAQTSEASRQLPGHADGQASRHGGHEPLGVGQ